MTPPPGPHTVRAFTVVRRLEDLPQDFAHPIALDTRTKVELVPSYGDVTSSP